MGGFREAGAAASSRRSAASGSPTPPSVRETPLSDQPTQAGPGAGPSPGDRAIPPGARETYEKAIARLGSRQERALRARIERRLAYSALAEELRVATPGAARTIVTRALARLVGGGERSRPESRVRLDGLVASVADGWPADWNAIEGMVADEATRRSLCRLRAVAAVADLHRRGAQPPRSGRRTGHRSDPSAAEKPPRAAAAEVQPIPALGEWGRFVLLKKLGEGAYGEVYQAHDTQLDREVALKLLKVGRASADPGQRLLREARMLARVRHPNVASVFGAGEHDGRAGMWMELVRGVNLEELLRAHGPMSACEAALVGMDVCRALAAVHAAGLVHRDVKASNVMREVGGRIVLADFGAGSGPGQRHRRQLAGTPLYLAPEVLGGSEATTRSDLYSLGVVLFRMVTATYPRRLQSFESLREPCVLGGPASLRDLRPDLPDAFVTALELALADDPAARPPSAGAFRSALALVLGVPNSWRKACRWPRTALSSAPTAGLASLATTLDRPPSPPARPSR